MKRREIYEKYLSQQYKQPPRDIERERDSFVRKLNQSIPKLRELVRGSNVLDLGCGFGPFTRYCEIYKPEDYTAIDTSNEEIDLCKDRFPDFSFKKIDVFRFLEDTKTKFDIIFASHFLEHFTKEEGGELLRLIHKALAPQGRLITIIPNAGAYFNACASRYVDITHETLYTPKGFNQMLYQAHFDKIEHRNYYIGKNRLQHLIHKITLRIFERFIQTLGYDRQEIYTPSMITIARK